MKVLNSLNVNSNICVGTRDAQAQPMVSCAKSKDLFMPIVSPTYYSPSFMGKNSPTNQAEKVKEERKNILDKWENHLFQEESGYNPDETIYILKSITENLRDDNDALPPELDKCILRITMSRYRENPEGFNFRKEYRSDVDKLGYKDDGIIMPKNHELDRFTTHLKWDAKMGNPDYIMRDDERKEWLDFYLAKTGLLDEKLSNVYRLPGTKNSYRGQTLRNQDDETYGKLVESGIKTIVDFSGQTDMGATRYMAKEHGIEYIPFPVNKNLSPVQLFNAEEFTLRKRVNNLTNYISAMRKDNVYVCCLYGQDETRQALQINNWFNPDRKLENACGTLYILDYVSEMYEALTDEDKAKMGWDENFEENFLEKLEEEYLTINRTFETDYNPTGS